MKRLAILIGLAVCHSLARAGEQSLIEARYGVDELVTISGSGMLTIGQDTRGRITVCRWPGPGFPDHLGVRHDAGAGAAVPNGLQWGVGIGDDLFWPGDMRLEATQEYDGLVGNIGKTTLRIMGTSAVIVQLTCVHPATGALVSHIKIEGADSPPSVYWSADISPCTRLLPGIPMADDRLDSLNDFAAFALEGERRVCHFRPSAPGAVEWERAAALLHLPRPSLDQWTAFNAGVWAVYTSFNPILAYACDTSNALPRTRPEAEGAPARLHAVGQTASWIRIEPSRRDGAYEASVVLAFGSSYEKANARVKATETRGAMNLLKDVREYWAKYASESQIPENAGAATALAATRALTTLRTLCDDSRGAIVRSPAVRPALARDWPRHGAWIAYALDLAGQHAEAKRHLMFYLDAIRTERTPGAPIGSIPASLYGDGTAASPDMVLDAEGTAWALWCIRRHGDFLESDARKKFFASAWERAALAAQFLVDWADSRRGFPERSFDPDLGHDGKPPALLFAVHQAMVCIAEMAAEIERPVPADWTRRMGQLDVLVRNLVLDESTEWGTDFPLPLLLGEWLSSKNLNPGVRARIEAGGDERLRQLPSLGGHAAARALCEAVMLFRNDPGRLGQIREMLPDLLPRSVTVTDENGETRPARPDALDAAYCFVAISIAHGD